MGRPRKVLEISKVVEKEKKLLFPIEKDVPILKSRIRRTSKEYMGLRESALHMRKNDSIFCPVDTPEEAEFKKTCHRLRAQFSALAAKNSFKSASSIYFNDGKRNGIRFWRVS